MPVLSLAPSSRVRHQRRTRLGWRVFPRKHSPHLCCFYESNLQLESLALPRVTRVAEESATERAHGVRQYDIMEDIVLPRVLAPLLTRSSQLPSLRLWNLSCKLRLQVGL